jgi:hypothetical protein
VISKICYISSFWLYLLHPIVDKVFITTRGVITLIKNNVGKQEDDLHKNVQGKNLADILLRILPDILKLLVRVAEYSDIL